MDVLCEKVETTWMYFVVYSTSYYVILERFFMVENVRKAIKIDEHVMDSLTTSMVDDGFNVLQHCCCRWISTSNIHSVIAALSSAKTGIDIATALNNMDVSGEYALKLRHEIEEQCAE
ncbi:conserved oligomeric Golgi complex subunit 4, partial [Tanacetum coccineum]